MTDEHEPAPEDVIKLDGVLVDVGLAQVLSGPAGASERIIDKVVPHAVEFLRGGGSWTWAEWNRLSNETRAAMAAAGNIIANQDAARLAMALRDPDALVAMQTGEPYEDVRNENALADAMDALETAAAT